LGNGRGVLAEDRRLDPQLIANACQVGVPVELQNINIE